MSGHFAFSNPLIQLSLTFCEVTFISVRIGSLWSQLYTMINSNVPFLKKKSVYRTE